MTESHRIPRASWMGMWLFLFTEILLFGGLFLIYAVYRRANAEAFHIASGELSLKFGAINTVILLTSSLTMVLAVSALERGLVGRCLRFLAGTAGLGLVFLVNKAMEWSAKFAHGLYPGNPILEAKPAGEKLFISLYFAMTGLHGVHVLVGIVVIAVSAVLVRRAQASVGENAGELYGGVVENAGLYWHLVDTIWIFLFPLFYLIS